MGLKVSGLTSYCSSAVYSAGPGFTEGLKQKVVITLREKS